MANRFILNETSYHGAGAIKEIVTEFKARGFKKAFVASDPGLIQFGVTAKVTDLLDEAGIAYEIYSNIQPNPTIENVQTGVKAFADAGADMIIAIGGGSSMDTSKAIGVINTYAVDGCMPDMTILLRLDPAKGSSRIADREHDRIEQASDAFHRKVYEGYLKLEEMYPDRIVGIDASGTINEIAEEISGRVKEMMNRG